MLLCIAAASCARGGDRNPRSEGGLPTGSEPANLNPGELTTEIDNPYWPIRPGSEWVYRETAGDGTIQEVVVTVTDQTKTIANGVVARVVRDTVTENGVPVEVTDDWYAQDAEGNIWYLGEATTEYEEGKPKTTAGSFEAGVDGAEAGIVMPANPKPGMEYRQEYYEGEAEDKAKILALGEQVTVPAGSFTDTVKTEDTNPLEDPPDVENKFYARGVGPVYVVGVSGEGRGDREELISYKIG